MQTTMAMFCAVMCSRCERLVTLRIVLCQPVHCGLVSFLVSELNLVCAVEDMLLVEHIERVHKWVIDLETNLSMTHSAGTLHLV